MKKYINAFYLKACLMLVSLGAIFLYVYAFYTTDNDILVNSHDNLDSNVAIYKLLADTGTFFSPKDTVIGNVMNGLPRAALPSEYNMVSMLYYFLTPKNAYIVNEMLIRLVAFFGMLLLLRKYVLNEDAGKEPGCSVASLGIALAFSLLPYWSNAGASIAGQPFVLYAFLNVKNKDYRFTNWLILFLFPFYSSLIFAGMFVLAMLLVVSIHGGIKNRELNYHLFLVMAGMSVLYLCIDYRLLANLLDPAFVSHRQEFEKKYLTYSQSISRSADLFFDGQHHANSIHGAFLLPFIYVSTLALVLGSAVNKYSALCLAALIVFSVIYFNDYYGAQWVSVIHEHVFESVYRNYYVLSAIIIAITFFYIKEYMASYVIIAILAISLFSGFEDFQGIEFIKDSFPILKQVKFDRFYALFPFLWFLLFALSSKRMLKKSGYSLLIIVLVLSMQVSYSMTLRGVVTSEKLVGIDSYYSYDVYDEVKKYINEHVSSYRVMSLGLPPAVAIYNGFYTLDAYLPNYPVQYKHEFRKIIAPELEKSERLKHYYDSWGSRCRLVSESREINLNLEQFKEMGGKYIFSRYEVAVNNGVNIDFLKKFSKDNSLYSIYLYRVN